MSVKKYPMKKIFSLLAFSLCFIVSAQTNKIVFEYDSAGNQIKRYLCLNCPSSTGKKAFVKEIDALADEDLLKFSPKDLISYYPNPVREELYLKWELIENKFVTSIQVISITGQVLRTFEISSANNNQNIAFQSYPSGIYLVYCTIVTVIRSLLKL